MALRLGAGYRLANGIGLGAVARMGFPQMNILGTNDRAAYQQLGFGVQGSYLIKGWIEPYAEFLPYAQLSLTSVPGAAARPTQNYTYEGQAWGAGVRMYLPSLAQAAARIGMALAYVHDRYPSAKLNSSSTPASFNASNRDLMAGNSYQMSLLIGL